MRFIDITGQKYGRLTVISFIEMSKNHKAMWLCRCDCGKEVIAILNNLRTGSTQSCGCLHTEHTISLKYSHGFAGTRLYKCWQEMMRRCYGKNRSAYRYYGGRGICVCNEWHNFENFKNWALSNGYAENLSIDRIGVNGNYEPSNCR